MPAAPSIVGIHWAIFASILASVLLLLLLAKRGVDEYQHAFVRSMSMGLRQNFIIANPKILFVVHLLFVPAATTFGYCWIGPVGGVGFGLLAAAAPRGVIAIFAKRRARRFVYQLPDALSAVASALRAGSNLAKAMELLAARQPAPLSQEFTIVLAESRVGRPLSESLNDMSKRVKAPEIHLMNTAINVSRRVGGNLADTLESLANTLREKAHMEGKIDALTSMGRAQGWVVSLLPVFIGLVLYQQQPERMSLLFTEWYGWIVLGVVAVMMAVAAWMIRKIVNIDV